MEARFLEDNKKPGYDLVYVKIDEHSLSYLQQGLPLRMAFFTDKNDHLPWYERSAMVVMIGSNFDLAKEEKSWTDSSAKEAVVDRSYLMASMQDVQKRLISALSEELNKLGVSTEFIPKPSVYLGNKPVSLEPISEGGADDVAYFNTIEASKKLGISVGSLITLAEEGKILAKHDDYLRGWAFPEHEINKLLDIKPDFLQEIWDKPGSVKKGGRVPARIILEGKEYIHFNDAKRKLKLSYPAMMKNIGLGLLKMIRHDRSIYISADYLKELIKNPPEWFIKARTYFNKGLPKKGSGIWKRLG